MEHPAKRLTLQLFFLTLFVGLINLTALAQDDGGSTTTSTTKTTTSVTRDTTWYTSPWVWVVGAAVFILLLVALLSNRGGRSETVRVTKTVEKD
jgi:hypothetical protein